MYQSKTADGDAKLFQGDFEGYDDPRTKLDALKMFDLDGIVLNNEEPYSFETTSGERDATVFNNVVQGHAPVNNGFLSYKSHSGMELYARNFESDAFSGSMPMTSEHADSTWHSKVGFDFVAAYTNRYTEYPHQMFDRSARVLDRVYVILRRYNVFKDILEEKTKNEPPSTRPAKMRAIFDGMKVQGKNGEPVPYKEANKLWFVQYMPCTSRAFQLYRDSDAANRFVGGNSKQRAKMREHAPGLAARVQRLGLKKGMGMPESKMDAVREDDLRNCIGAYCIGKIVDASAAAAERHRFAPVNSSYRMQVSVKVSWHNMWKPFDDTERKFTSKLAHRQLLEYPEKKDGSAFRRYAGYRRSKSLSELESIMPLQRFRAKYDNPQPQINEPLMDDSIMEADVHLDVETPPQASLTAIADRTAAPTAPAAQSVPPGVDQTLLVPSAAPAAVAAAPEAVAAPVAAVPETPTAATPAATPAAVPTAVPAAVPAAALKSKAEGKKTVGSSKKSSALVDETIARMTKPPAPVPTPPAPAATTSKDTVVDSVFDKIFGPQGTVPPRSDAPSPTPSSGSESAPKTFSRRSR